MEPTNAEPQADPEDPLALLGELALGDEGCRCFGQRRAKVAEALASLQERLREQRQRIQHLEEAARESQVQLVHCRGLFEFAPDPYVETDLAGIILEANYAATVMFHRSKDFLIGKPLPFLVLPESRGDFFTWLVRLRSVRGASQSWDMRVQPRKRAPLDATFTVTPTLDREGRPARLRWLIRDVTAQKRLLEDLRAGKQFADSLIDNAEVFVLVVSPDGLLVRASAHLEAVSGYERQELLGLGWQDLLFSLEEVPLVWQHFQQALQAGHTIRATRPLLTRDGARRTVAWTARPLTFADGSSSAVLAVGHDITELERLQQQALALERLATIGEMATGLAHESRNALQRGQACLERLRWKLQGQEETLDLVTRAQKAQEDLLRLYEDVRAYAAPISIERQHCDLGEVWREVWGELTLLAAGRQLTLEEETNGVSLTCDVAPFRLAQVFRNIFENSLAACADPVCVRISCGDGEVDSRPALRISVRDNGPGLNAEQKQRLFEPFYTTKVKGTGLGMAIAERIIEAHGGRIIVGEAPAPGAEIILLLPRSQA